MEFIKTALYGSLPETMTFKTKIPKSLEGCQSPFFIQLISAPRNKISNHLSGHSCDGPDLRYCSGHNNEPLTLLCWKRGNTWRRVSQGREKSLFLFRLLIDMPPAHFVKTEVDEIYFVSMRHISRFSSAFHVGIIMAKRPFLFHRYFQP